MAIRSDGLQRLESILSKRTERLDPIVEAVVAVLLTGGLDAQVLLVQRAERDGDPWSGHMGLPGGRIKPTDTSPVDASKREVREEVGLDLDALHSRLLGSLSASFPWNRPEMKVLPLVFNLGGRPRVAVGPEIVEAYWVSLSNLPQLKNKSEVETRLGKRTVDSYLVEGKIVWGFTFRVLTELLDLFQAETD